MAIVLVGRRLRVREVMIGALEGCKSLRYIFVGVGLESVAIVFMRVEVVLL